MNVPGRLRVIQRHRVEWILAWLAALPEDDCSDADTVAADEN